MPVAKTSKKSEEKVGSKEMEVPKAAEVKTEPTVKPIDQKETTPKTEAAAEAKPKAAVATPAPANSAVNIPPVSQMAPRQQFNRPVSNYNQRPNYGGQAYNPQSANNAEVEAIAGYLDDSTDGHAVIRPHFHPSERDAYMSSMVVRRLGLRPGDYVEGTARKPKDNERYWALVTVTKVNGKAPSETHKRIKFHNLTPIYPIQKIVLEMGVQPLSNRVIDLVAPIGRGQRGMIVAPPKAGKTTIMKDMVTGIAKNYPEIHLMTVLIGERPEEVTDIRRHLEKVTENSVMKGECAASNFDEPAEDQTRVAEIALERAKRLVEEGMDVVILLDSVTRLARAYNLAIPTSGRTLSGGFDPAALYPPKRFFGAARKMEDGGSLTIIGTALVDTGSRMDELIYEEFKGTGNMELVLDRRLSERRIFPAIDVYKSGTRREDLLFSSSEYQNIVMMRRMLDMLNDDERTAVLVERLNKSKSNKEFLAMLKEG
jgi:transcription termination factor Rho